MAGMFKGAIFIRVLSYFPLISAILSPSLLVLGQIGIIDVLASIIIVIVTIVKLKTLSRANINFQVFSDLHGKFILFL